VPRIFEHKTQNSLAQHHWLFAKESDCTLNTKVSEQQLKRSDPVSQSEECKLETRM